MAKGYSARRGFSNGSGQMLKQQQMQQQMRVHGLHPKEKVSTP